MGWKYRATGMDKVATALSYVSLGMATVFFSCTAYQSLQTLFSFNALLLPSPGHGRDCRTF